MCLDDFVRSRLTAKSIASAVCGIVFWAAAAVDAQTAELTLKNAVQLARQQAPQLQAQASALDAAQARAVAAGRLPDPELVTGVDDLPVTTRDAGSFSRDSMTMRRIGVMQSFPSERKRSADKQVAQAAIKVVQAQKQLTELEVARAAAEAWVDLYAAMELEASLSALKPELQLQASAVKARLSNGRTSSADALASQGALLDLDDRLLDARREVHAARAKLARWIGSDALKGTLSTAPEFERLPTPREVLLANLHNHGTILAFDAQIIMARSEVDRARADKRPDWSAEISYGKRSGQLSDMLTLEFHMGLPLFSGTRQDPLIRAKRADLAQVESERDTELRMHEEEVTTALATWESAHERLDLYRQQRLPLARERTQATLASYQAGGASLADMMGSVVAEIELRRSQTEIVRELGRSWVFLRYLNPQEDGL